MAVSVEYFFVSKADLRPLQLQLCDAIVRGIAEGSLTAGDKLPSSRSLALWLGISRMTVSLAYDELCAKGLLVSRRGSGVYIAESGLQALEGLPPPPQPQKAFSWARHLDFRHLTSQRKDRVQDWHRYRWCFTYGQSDPSIVDRSGWREATLQALSATAFSRSIEDHYDGDDPDLIAYICSHVLPRRGIHARPEQVLLTLGAQNALWLIAQILLGKGGHCVIEDPGYPGLKEILGQSAARITPVRVDHDGLPPEALPQGTDVVFMTASHQCPTGATMPLARKKALLDQALAQNFVIVEDDYEVQMSFEGRHLPALKAMDQSGAVIYVGSFSKSVFPALRIGYIVADDPFIREARALRSLSLRHIPVQMQRTLTMFMSSGAYDAQLRRTRLQFDARRKAMQAAFQRSGLTCAAPKNNGGSSFWMTLPEGVKAATLAAELLQRGVVIEPGEPFFIRQSDGERFYRLAYSSVKLEDIAEGIAQIAAAIGQSSPHPSRNG